MQLTHKHFGVLVRSAVVMGGLILSAPADPSAPSPETKPADAAQRPDPLPLKLPGLVIDRERRSVDVEASICLEEGYLELIACTKDSKEHESLVVIEALPVHIHTALLLLGARNGNPAMRRALNEEETRWVDLPPQGDLIEVSLKFEDSEGKMIERPISDFIARSDEHADDPAAADADDAAAARFSNTFIFAGSHLSTQESGPRKYLADLSGNVISIASFGDELLCLPDFQSHENGALVWRVDSTHLPKLGTKVTLRLSIKKKPEAQPTP